MYENTKIKAGFTLVELMVAMSVFVIAMTITSGVFVRAIRTQRQTHQLMIVQSDAGLILEKMAREMRLGFNFSLTDDFTGSCPTGTFDRIDFERARNGATANVTYRWDPLLESVDRREGVAAFASLNSPVAAVGRLCFVMTQESDYHPWRITILLSEMSADPILDYSVNLQTTISARLIPVLDIDI